MDFQVIYINTSWDSHEYPIIPNGQIWFQPPIPIEPIHNPSSQIKLVKWIDYSKSQKTPNSKALEIIVPGQHAYLMNHWISFEKKLDESFEWKFSKDEDIMRTCKWVYSLEPLGWNRIKTQIMENQLKCLFSLSIL